MANGANGAQGAIVITYTVTTSRMFMLF
jgi:hypothetical protein